MKTYKTSEVAAVIGVHPNTIRLYERMQLIPKPERQPNGYRIFTDFHIKQCELIRLAFQIEVTQNGLRKKIVQMLLASASGDFDTAIVLTEFYLEQLGQELRRAEEAVESVKQLLGGHGEKNSRSLKRREVSELLGISMDTLRNWEMNGLLTIKRRSNGYRVYTEEDIQRLKIIRSLRCANYSLEAILRLLHQLSRDPDTDIHTALNTPNQTDDLISVCDRLIVSLTAAGNNASVILDMLRDMKLHFS